VFRLNIGVDRPTAQRVAADNVFPDYATFDRLFPHPVYANQLWISILNPSASTFETVVVPLLALAHARLARTRPRHA
jgi:hypothetical protein